MSGEGLIADRPAERAGELDDVVAYLEQRRDNAETIATRSPEHADLARDRQRQLEVIIGDLRAGMHVGSTEVRAALKTSDDGGGR